MSEIKAIEKLRRSSHLDDDKWTLETGEVFHVFGSRPNDPNAVNWGERWRKIADEIEAEIAEVREITRKKHQAERVYWHNEFQKILDAINGRERFWGDCVDYPLPEATLPPSEVAKRMLAERYMLLPTDADGKPIHVGDMVDGWGTLEMHGCGKQPVHGMYCAASIASGIEWRIDNEYGFEAEPDHLRHVKQRTLEEIVTEAIEYGHGIYSPTHCRDAKVSELCAEIRDLLGGDE